MKTYNVTLPIAGHINLDVEAESEEEAIEKAFGTCSMDDITEWEALEQFTKGNVCYCPQPWEAAAELIDGGEE